MLCYLETLLISVCRPPIISVEAGSSSGSRVVVVEVVVVIVVAVAGALLQCPLSVIDHCFIDGKALQIRPPACHLFAVHPVGYWT